MTLREADLREVEERMIDLQHSINTLISRQADSYGVYAGSATEVNVKRASLDLTKALVDLRRQSRKLVKRPFLAFG
jgi:hypothetical protein